LSFREAAAFTILELLIVITIITILAGLTIATMGYVQDKAKRSRAEAEIAAISAACESYKADNGIYPTTTATNTVDPVANIDAISADKTKYQQASKDLYASLSGDTNCDGTVTDADKADPNGSLPKTYFAFKPQMLGGTKNSSGNFNSISYIQDPFGNSYGYSTAKAANPSGGAGYNPTFDLWSTAGTTLTTKWIKNW
jgi:type II secretory pathway pseudopilin PulG